MSYGFKVTGRTRALAIASATTELEKVVAAQPVHSAEFDAAVDSVNKFAALSPCPVASDCHVAVLFRRAGIGVGIAGNYVRSPVEVDWWQHWGAIDHHHDIIGYRVLAPTGIAKTELPISAADRPLAYLELSDEALGRFARRHLISCARAGVMKAEADNLPLDAVTSMHASISLYRIACKAKATTMTLKHEGVSWAGEEQGDWSLTITRDGK